MLILIKKEKEIKKYVNIFREEIKKSFGKSSLRNFSFPGGGKDEVNYYYAKKQFGIVSIGIPKREWNDRYVHLINTEPLDMKSITPDVEMNFPFTYNKNTAGCIVKDTSSEKVLICHRGKVNAYKGMIPLEVSKKYFKNNLIKVLDDGEEIEVIPITQIGSPEFLYDIYNFTKKVLQLKKLYKGKKNIIPNATVTNISWWENDEFEGIIEKKKMNHKVSYEYLHGEIRNSLFRELKEKFKDTKFSIKGNNNVDVAILDGENLKSIFEVKTSESFSEQLYKAIGQLFCYSHHYSNKQKNSPKLFLVLPNNCLTEVNRKIMEKLNINIILYKEGTFVLPNGKELKNDVLV